MNSLLVSKIRVGRLVEPDELRLRQHRWNEAMIPDLVDHVPERHPLVAVDRARHPADVHADLLGPASIGEAAELGGRPGGVLGREHRHPDQPLRVVAAELDEPVVVGAVHGEAQLGFVDLEGDGRAVHHRRLDAVVLHVGQPQLGIGRPEHPLLLEPGPLEGGLVRPLLVDRLARPPSAPGCRRRTSRPTCRRRARRPAARGRRSRAGSRVRHRVTRHVLQVDVIVDRDHLVVHLGHPPPPTGIVSFPDIVYSTGGGLATHDSSIRRSMSSTVRRPGSPPISRRRPTGGTTFTDSEVVEIHAALEHVRTADPSLALARLTADDFPLPTVAGLVDAIRDATRRRQGGHDLRRLPGRPLPRSTSCGRSGGVSPSTSARRSPRAGGVT